MKQFTRIKEYSDDELIMIVYDDEENWQKEAMIYAKDLLSKRGVSDEYSKERYEKIRNEIELFWEQELEERRTESYGIVILIFISIFWFKYIFSDWDLKRNGYLRMRKQRLIALGLGILVYFLIGLEANLSSEERKDERITEIERVGKQDSILKSQIDWTGSYVFIDSSSKSNGKIIWELDLIKNDGEHHGTLKIDNEKTIKCIGLVKDDLIEFFPDTTYILSNDSQVSYYDRLFTFARDSLKIYTKWEKLSPILGEEKSIENYFKIKQ